MRIREVTWLPQGHRVRPQLDACSDGLLGNATWRSTGAEAEFALDVLSRDLREAAVPWPVGSKVPHPGAQPSLPADYRLWQGP